MSKRATFDDKPRPFLPLIRLAAVLGGAALLWGVGPGWLMLVGNDWINGGLCSFASISLAAATALGLEIADKIYRVGKTPGGSVTYYLTIVVISGLVLM